jgi:uncharacterized protein YyaL (SSP411 family)
VGRVTNSLANAISPYLRSHAANPVAWQQWGAKPFDEAARRGVPVMVSIGYSTCHWCHVMARESFSDPVVAERLNRDFVSVKVDREEHPDVDASYLAAASAFTGNLGWPLTVFVTPEGRAFFAGTYFPPVPVQGQPSFMQVLDAVQDAWTGHRDEVEQSAARIAEALAATPDTASGSVPTKADIARVVALLASHEDPEFGGFGTAPKFPVAPVQLLLVDLAVAGSDIAAGLATRNLLAMAESPLRDPVEGGFFRYAVRRDWHEPHYERMLYDNALLLRAYSRLSAAVGSADGVAAGIADFLLATLRRPEGGFGSAQDSESDLGEGGYYALDAAGRLTATPPRVDDKVLTGWNGLAIGALAEAGARHGCKDWLDAAITAADRILDHHVATDGSLLRAATSLGVSDAVATLEDFGMLADGLLRLALATGRVEYAVQARRLVDACLVGSQRAAAGDDRVFAAPGEGDPVLAAQGLVLRSDPSEGAYPSGLSAIATASFTLSQLTADRRYREAATRAVASVSGQSLETPTAFGGMLSLAAGLQDPAVQLVVVDDAAGESSTSDLARFGLAWFQPGAVSTAVTSTQAVEWAEAGFDLFEGRVTAPGVATAYLCRDFVCRLPVTTIDELLPLVELTSTTGSSSAG